MWVGTAERQTGCLSVRSVGKGQSKLSTAGRGRLTGVKLSVQKSPRFQKSPGLNLSQSCRAIGVSAIVLCP